MQDVLRTTARIPFTGNEIEQSLVVLQQGQAKGRDYYCGAAGIPFSASDIEEARRDGLVFISSPVQLEQDFLFVKCDGGRSIFGNQKAVFKSYVGSPGHDEWMVGTTFTRWLMALTSIGNVYRGCGYS